MSSSAIVAMFIPVVLAIDHELGLNCKRMLMRFRSGAPPAYDDVDASHPT
jgi:hypothetical protein